LTRSSITVEFYGIPRQRAGMASCAVEGATLGQALASLAGRCPALAAACFSGDETKGYALHESYSANINGERFVRDPAAALEPGDTLLILSTDAGG
jgi:molybdopterin converting factor small subunit